MAENRINKYKIEYNILFSDENSLNGDVYSKFYNNKIKDLCYSYKLLRIYKNDGSVDDIPTTIGEFYKFGDDSFFPDIIRYAAHGKTNEIDKCYITDCYIFNYNEERYNNYYKFVCYKNDEYKYLIDNKDIIDGILTIAKINNVYKLLEYIGNGRWNIFKAPKYKNDTILAPVELDNLELLYNVLYNDYIYDKNVEVEIKNNKWLDSQTLNTNQIYQKCNLKDIYYKSSENTNKIISDVDLDSYLDSLTSDKNIWKTPSEYYSIQTTDISYTKTDNEMIVTDWFWMDDFKNWATWIILDLGKNDYYITLGLWNGKNGWDLLYNMVELYNSGRIEDLLNTYYYKHNIFNVGPVMSSFMSMATFRNVSQVIDVGIISYNSVILTQNTKYSTYDTKSFQNIHNSNIIIDNNRTAFNVDYSSDYLVRYSIQNYKLNVMANNGCPCILRNATGRLMLLYLFKCTGNLKYGEKEPDSLLIKDINNINKVTKLYFEDGSDKTMNDWKRFNKMNKFEETPSDINNIEKYSKNNIITSVADNNSNTNLVMNFNAPRPNETNMPVSENDIVERWNK